MQTRCILITLPGGWAGDFSHVTRHCFKRGPLCSDRAAWRMGWVGVEERAGRHTDMLKSTCTTPSSTLPPPPPPPRHPPVSMIRTQRACMLKAVPVYMIKVAPAGQPNH